MKSDIMFFVVMAMIMLALAMMFILFPLFPVSFGGRISAILLMQFFAVVFGLRVGKLVKGIPYPLFFALMIAGIAYSIFVFLGIKENNYTLYSSFGNIYLTLLLILDLYIFSRREKTRK